MNCGKNQVSSIRSNSDISVKSVQNCMLLQLLSCAQSVGIQNCACSAVRENVCAGAKKHSCLWEPGRDVTCPSLPLYIYSVPSATSNDQCHAEIRNLGGVPVVGLQREARSISQPVLRWNSVASLDEARCHSTTNVGAWSRV